MVSVAGWKIPKYLETTTILNNLCVKKEIKREIRNPVGFNQQAYSIVSDRQTRI